MPPPLPAHSATCLHVSAAGGSTMSKAYSRWLPTVVCGLSLAALLSPIVSAQGSAGRIAGTVRDEQAGVLPGVLLTLRNQATGVVHTQTTEGDGRFVFPALAPGR